MKFWASSESDKLSSGSLEQVRRRVEPYLNAAFSSSSFGSVPGKIRYVPIVMPKTMHSRYPERSKLRKKERIYDCAPIIDYETFVSGTFEDQIREYLRGISLTAPHLEELGLVPDQIKEFENIVRDAAKNILAN